jgi:hypothetical protein
MTDFEEWWIAVGRIGLGIVQEADKDEFRMCWKAAWGAATERAAKKAEDLYGNEPDEDYNRQLKKAGRNIAEAIRGDK